MDAVNKISLKQKFINYKNHPGSLIMLLITWLAALLTAAVVALFLGVPYWKGKIAEKRVKPAEEVKADA